ncbi:uncharacterized protein LOC119673406 [Teleopsis dalmanni]|uniref:uncharacterized protein LOC119673406 n=1 Tax=Teleopsis dalmanni TaxID=139649 RepID=UPI0018CE7E33|nr:uncharacterized protein LOC119673406 [Teleopsis dalmanni]XP_037940605.1 uncharacterized protein LOC119673406 [Teleopsis dalmanni]
MSREENTAKYVANRKEMNSKIYTSTPQKKIVEHHANTSEIGHKTPQCIAHKKQTELDAVISDTSFNTSTAEAQPISHKENANKILDETSTSTFQNKATGTYANLSEILDDSYTNQNVNLVSNDGAAASNSADCYIKEEIEKTSLNNSISIFKRSEDMPTLCSNPLSQIKPQFVRISTCKHRNQEVSSEELVSEDKLKNGSCLSLFSEDCNKSSGIPDQSTTIDTSSISMNSMLQKSSTTKSSSGSLTSIPGRLHSALLRKISHHTFSGRSACNEIQFTTILSASACAYVEIVLTREEIKPSKFT